MSNTEFILRLIGGLLAGGLGGYMLGMVIPVPFGLLLSFAWGSLCGYVALNVGVTWQNTD